MNTENEDTAIFLEDNSYRVIKIGIPVVITLLLDAFLTRFIEELHESTSYDRSLSETINSNNASISTANSIYIALFLIVGILVVTGILLTCYYFGCTKIIYAWMIIAVTMILSFYVYQTFGSVPELLNVPFDYISLVLFFLNLIVVGDISIFWRSPPIVTQTILIFISILIAIAFLQLPDWTIWVLLVLLVVYDCCVVLCPFGLLNMLIKKSEERGDEIPALVYASAAYHMPEDHNGNEYEGWEERSGSDEQELSSEKSTVCEEESDESVTTSVTESENEAGDGDTNVPHAVPPPPEESFKLPPPPKKERDGVRLGLGDFCFYGILITRAARQGWDLVIMCSFAVILGLALTLLFLAIFQRPLPALPCSLVFGIIFFLIGALTFRKFDANLNEIHLVF